MTLRTFNDAFGDFDSLSEIPDEKGIRNKKFKIKLPDILSPGVRVWVSGRETSLVLG